MYNLLMWQIGHKQQQLITAVMTALITGLFVGKLAGERLFLSPAGLLFVSLLAIVTAWKLCQQRPFNHNWPFLLLLPYLFMPIPAIGIAAALSGLILVITLQQKSWPTFQHEHWYIFLIATLYFGSRVATGILPADAGEFQTIVPQLGVLHPTGFPLYSIIGWLFVQLPLAASPAYELNLFSALLSAASLGLLYASLKKLSDSRVAALTAVVALAGSQTFQAQAATTNIRALTLFFITLWLYLFLRFQQDRTTLPWLAAAVVLGISHHISLAFPALCLIAAVFLSDRSLWRQPQRWRQPLIFATAALIPYLYLPWRAWAGAPGASSTLLSWSGFLDHILGRGFQGDFFYFTEPAILFSRLMVMRNVLTIQFHPFLLIGAFFGALLILRKRPVTALFIVGGFLIQILIVATYRAPQTMEYLLPAYLLLVVMLAYFLQSLCEYGGKLPLLLTSSLLVAGGSALIQAHPQRVNDPAAANMTQLLQQAPPNALLLADWHFYTPLTYLQQLEGIRPDVTVTFVFPTDEPYVESWKRQINDALAEEQPVITTHWDPAFASLPPPLPLANSFLFTTAVIKQLPPEFIPHPILLNELIYIHGYQLETTSTAAGELTQLTIAWEAAAPLPPATSLFVHLTTAAGQLTGQDDQPARPREQGLTLTQFRITSGVGAQPGQYQLLTGAYQEQPFLNRAGERRSQLTEISLLPRDQMLYTAHPVMLKHENGARLRGYDWDLSFPEPRLYLHWERAGGFTTEIIDNELPTLTLAGGWGLTRPFTPAAPHPSDRYIPFAKGIIWLGSNPLPNPLQFSNFPLQLTPRFAASSPLYQDQVISVRVVGYEADQFHWAWSTLYDSIPALGSIPTLKWESGDLISSPHFLPLPDPLPTNNGSVEATVRLYDAFTGRPLPILDERLPNPWISLGRSELRSEN